MVADRLAGSGLPDRSVLIAFLFFVLAAGGASVAIRMAYAEMAPFWVGTARFVLGALIFWVIVLIKRIPIPRGRAALGAVIFGVLTVGLAFTMAGWGLIKTPASRAQLLMATVPLLTIFLSSLHGIEAISRRGVLGSLLTIGGIGLTVGGSTTSDLSIPHIAAILLAAAFIAEGGVLIKKFPANPPVMTNAIAMTAGAIMLALVSLANGEKWTIPTQLNTWIAMIYLVLIVTVLAFLLYMFVLGKWSASGTSYGFVMVPLITIVVASIVAGEEITVNFLLGAGLVLAGVFVGALLPSKTKPVAVEECKSRSGQVLPRCV